MWTIEATGLVYPASPRPRSSGLSLWSALCACFGIQWFWIPGQARDDGVGSGAADLVLLFWPGLGMRAIGGGSFTLRHRGPRAGV